MQRRTLIAQGLATGAAALVAPSIARAAWPEREITIIVQYGPGGSTDVSTRAIAAEAEKILGVPVQIVNRPGGQGTVGVQTVAAARPDGYTIGTTGLAGLAIAPHMLDVTYKSDDFTFLPSFARYLYGIAVRAESPHRTIMDLVNAAKARRTTFGATGAPNNIGMFDIARVTGTRFQFIPFGSGAEAVTATLGGHVDAVIQNPPEMLPALESGRLRLLASASDIRWKEYPDVPTLREQGVDVTVDSMIGIIGPKGIPQDRAELLSRAFLEAARKPALAEILGRFGMVTSIMQPAEFESTIRAAFDRFGPQLREAGLARRR
ncbi:tripartite tricarboxylate transporter substrate binding protein [Roseococcus sp. SYP-B2431]|uniref:Bug family tripartite tricarboxylate transporter substrate binding protein n=1 Tax=Roseococcus sp. SYP-B2431 TaxID=2496640 RepID=UPI00103A9891|nr:tripartite tricarboxylate transporter substrate binding protein [Roseococcus sp. SYP-B2431]TCH98293.1 tripartite tricarboxylate transporter substrate binding protein [Roseococcus sp. SYP-B2431]